MAPSMHSSTELSSSSGSCSCHLRGLLAALSFYKCEARKREMSLPRLRVEVVELNLVVGDRLAFGIEDEEARGSGALVNAAHEPAFVLLFLGLLDTLGQDVIVQVHLGFGSEWCGNGQVTVLDKFHGEGIGLLFQRCDETDGTDLFVKASPLVVPDVGHLGSWPPGVGCGDHLDDRRERAGRGGVKIVERGIGLFGVVAQGRKR